MGLFDSSSPDEKLHKAVAKAVKWLAAEHNFFEELKRDLEDLRRDLGKAKKSPYNTADMIKAFHSFSFVGKCERRAKSYETDVERKIDEYVKTIKVSGYNRRDYTIERAYSCGS